MARIRSLKPNVTRDEATEQFSSGLMDVLHTTTSGPLKSVADFYVPSSFFRLKLSMAASAISAYLDRTR